MNFSHNYSNDKEYNEIDADTDDNDYDNDNGFDTIDTGTAITTRSRV